MSTRLTTLALTLLACGCSPTVSLNASEAVFFRSDRGIALETTTRLPEDLDVAGTLRWRVPTDPGHSSPTVCGGKIFLTTFRSAEKELATAAYDQVTGRLLWRQVAPATRLELYHRATGSPAAATPASDGERVYVFFGSYGLICYDLDGNKLWDQPMPPFQDEFGASSSPILLDGKLILNEDHDLGSFLLALDSKTGRTVWKVSRPDAVRSYSTPALWTRHGRKELLVAGSLELAAYEPSSGEKLWWIYGLSRIVIPAPVPAEDTIFMASWTPGGDPGKRLALDGWTAALAKWDRNHDGKLAKAEIDNPEVLDRFFRMDLDASGDLDQKEWERHAEIFRRAENAALAIRPGEGRGDLTSSSLAWKHQRGAPYVATPLVHEGRFWMVKDGGIVTKLESRSGRLLQEERLPGMGGYYASPVAGDGKVYFAGELGVVSVVADQNDWRVLSARDFHEKIYATPVIERSCIYIRTDQALYCFGPAEVR
jgi:outer membrane protein assembly factor BamB